MAEKSKMYPRMRRPWANATTARLEWSGVCEGVAMSPLLVQCRKRPSTQPVSPEQRTRARLTRGGQKAAARQPVTQFSQADLVERIGVGWRCNQGLIPIEVRSALIVDGLSDYLAVEVRPAFHSDCGVWCVDHSEVIGAASYGHTASATIVDHAIARKVRCISKGAASHI